MSRGAGIVVGAVALLAGCTDIAGVPAARSPSPTSTPTPSATRQVAPDIPIQGTDLQPIVPPVPPIRVRVPDAGIDVAIEPVGVLATGEMELPADTKVAGWYRFGPDPTSPTGATILASHVDSLKYGKGPFSRLRDLGTGSIVVVTTVDGGERSYVIESVSSVSKREIPLDQVFDKVGPPRLVLITCGGQFDYETGHYLDNILVTAVPVP